MITGRAKLAMVCLGIIGCTAVLQEVQEALAGERQYRPVLLDRGILRQHEWALTVVRGNGSQAAQRPCMRIVHRPQFGQSELDFDSYLTSCSALPRGGPPNVFSFVSGDDDREISVFGMAFSPQVRSVHLDFGADGVMRLRLKRLNNIQMRNAGVRSLRYAAFALKGDRCLRQIKGFDAVGAEIYQGPIDQCPEFEA